MKKNKSSISKTQSYREIGDFWDNHDLMDFSDQSKPVEFEVDIQSEKSYFPVERDLANEVTKIAQKRGVAAETLLNLWIKEKIIEQRA